MAQNETKQGGLDPREVSPVYTTTDLTKELRQGEIISDLAQYEFDPVTNSGIETFHDYVIVAGQDCDLLQDYDKTINGREGQLISVLLYKLFSVDQIDTIAERGSDIRKRIKQNKDERYHFLEAVVSNLDLFSNGFPALIIDFKRYFAMPPKEIYRQVDLEDGAKRRCRLETPYREHLQARATFYQQRVMLPVPHMTL